LMGQSQAQRSGLTVNNAQYYIDTSVGKDTQTSNVFEKGHTYYAYFLFAKPNTKQTYQIYVGKDATWDPKTNVKMVRAEFPSFPYIFNQGTWPTANAGENFAGWKRDATDGAGAGYNSTTGIETIIVDMNNYKTFSDDYNTSKANECAPAGFCALEGSQCKCQLDSNDPLFNDCDSVCGKWANKDIKCPNGKCFGFSVTLSDKFETIPKAEVRPQPTPGCFPNDIFNISVTNVGAGLAGDCSTAVIPPFQACN
jgi:cell migration-inducing and hyaluronan-binding protein